MGVCSLPHSPNARFASSTDEAWGRCMDVDQLIGFP